MAYPMVYSFLHICRWACDRILCIVLHCMFPLIRLIIQEFQRLPKLHTPYDDPYLPDPIFRR